MIFKDNIYTRLTDVARGEKRLNDLQMQIIDEEFRCKRTRRLMDSRYDVEKIKLALCHLDINQWPSSGWASKPFCSECIAHIADDLGPLPYYGVDSEKPDWWLDYSSCHDSFRFNLVPEKLSAEQTEAVVYFLTYLDEILKVMEGEPEPQNTEAAEPAMVITKDYPRLKKRGWFG